MILLESSLARLFFVLVLLRIDDTPLRVFFGGITRFTATVVPLYVAMRTRPKVPLEDARLVVYEDEERR